jgi:hypothetical protein
VDHVPVNGEFTKISVRRPLEGSLYFLLAFNDKSPSGLKVKSLTAILLDLLDRFIQTLAEILGIYLSSQHH